MPQMGYDMQEGTIVRWLKSEGAEIERGEPIAEIETDKAVVEFESYASGVLHQILVQEGSTVPVGQAIAVIGAEGEAPVVTEPTADEEAAGEPEPSPEAPATLPQAPAPIPEAEEPPLPARVSQVRASPVARRIAQERGIDLSQLEGTGPGGRITREDVLSYAVAAPAAATAPPAEAPAPAEAEAPAPAEAAVVGPAAPLAAAAETVPLTRMRQQIARVTVKSKSEIPHFYVTSEIDMTQAMGLRQQMNQALEAEGVRVTVNDMVIKACVAALREYPKFNASFSDDGIRMHEHINMGVAIAEEEGLIVPAIMDCANKSLREIAIASKDLAERAKSGALHPQEYTGGTFSVSNLGMFEVTSFAAIIHPPEAAVLAVGTVGKRPVVREGQVTVADIMNATLSADHRVADGAEGARFLVEVKRVLENPYALLA